MSVHVASNLAQLSFDFEGFPAEATRPRGWSYLLADSVSFNKSATHGIRIQKPEEEKIPAWICRLITSGQCKNIYVENLNLPNAEKEIIQKLCKQYAVALFNLQVMNDDTHGTNRNVIFGPW